MHPHHWIMHPHHWMHINASWCCITRQRVHGRDARLITPELSRSIRKRISTRIECSFLGFHCTPCDCHRIRILIEEKVQQQPDKWYHITNHSFHWHHVWWGLYARAVHLLYRGLLCVWKLHLTSACFVQVERHKARAIIMRLWESSYWIHAREDMILVYNINSL